MQGRRTRRHADEAGTIGAQGLHHIAQRLIMRLQHAALPGRGGTRAGGILGNALRAEARAAALRQGQAAALGRGDLHAVLQHAHQAAVRILAHHEARAQRAHLAMGRAHGEGRALLPALRRRMGQQGALPQDDGAAARAKIQVRRRTRIQRDGTAIGQREIAPLTRARAQVSHPLVEGCVAVGHEGGAHSHAAQAQRAAQHAAAPADAGLGTLQGVAHQPAACWRYRRAQRRQHLLQRRLQALPGQAVARVGLQPALETMAFAVADLARVQRDQPAHGCLGGGIQAIAVLVLRKRGRHVSPRAPPQCRPAGGPARWQCAGRPRPCGGAPCSGKCATGRQWPGRSGRRSGSAKRPGAP